MTHKQPAIRLHVRFYPGPDDDLIQWLAQLDEHPFGGRAQAIKEALRRGIGFESAQSPTGIPALDPADLRQVVEAAVASALLQAGTPLALAPAADQLESDETEDLLDSLEQVLVLRDQT